MERTLLPRTTTPLTDPKCEAARPRQKAYKLFDGDGLHLMVKPSGTKSWRMRIKRPNGKETTLTFGNYPALTLKQARGRRDEAQSLLAQGLDPVEQARIQREGNALTFAVVAKRWHGNEYKRGKWSAKHADRIWREMEENIFAGIGSTPIDKLRTRDLLVPLRAVEERDALEMAARLKQRIVSVMRYAVQHDLIQSNPAHDLVGAVTTRKAKHRPALPLERLPELLERIETYRGRRLTRLALLLTLHTFVRSSELRFARWHEVDFARALWTIPPEREPLPGVEHSHRGSKMHDTHLVPLTAQALDILHQAHEMTGCDDLILPSDAHPQKAMSENTINHALRRMGYDTQKDVCGHGFRTMACSALVESGLWSRDAVERQMSHQERNGVRAAYIHKAEHLQERRLMLQWWSNYLDTCREGYVPPYESAAGHNVTPIGRTA